MNNSNKGVRIFLIALAIFSVVTSGIVYRSSHFLSMLGEREEIYRMAEDVLAGYVDDSQEVLRESASLLGGRRLSQKVTVTTDANMMPIGGTVTKCKDDFYPGTYEVRFSNKKILCSKATVVINIDVEPGEKVYVLTGNRVLGYKDFATIEASDKNMISFETNVLQDYTVSTMDIVGAQKAMEVLLSYNK